MGKNPTKEMAPWLWCLDEKTGRWRQMEEMRPANNSRTKRALDNGRFYVDDIRTDKLSHINIVILWNGCYDQAQALIFNHSTPKIVMTILGGIITK